MIFIHFCWAFFTYSEQNLFVDFRQITNIAILIYVYTHMCSKYVHMYIKYVTNILSIWSLIYHFISIFLWIIILIFQYFMDNLKKIYIINISSFTCRAISFSLNLKFNCYRGNIFFPWDIYLNQLQDWKNYSFPIEIWCHN